MTTQSKRVSKAYKYFMIFLCMFTQAIPFGITQNIQPLFIHPIVNTFHFNLASYTLIFTFGALSSAIASPFVGKAMGKVNFKLMYMIGIVISSIAFVIFGISSKLPEFYIAGILCMIGSTFFSSQGVPWVINHWFPGNDRGIALGIAFCGGSIGNIFLQPFTQLLLKHYTVGSPKYGHLISMLPFFIFAVLLFIIGLVVSIFIRTPKPNEVVVTTTLSNENKQAKATGFEGWTSKQVIKMPWFWIFSVGFLIIGLALASLSEDYAAFLDTKMTFASVGIVGSVYGIGGLIGNITGGVLFDKLGSAKAMIYAAIMYLISLSMMIFVSFQSFNSFAGKIGGCGYALFAGLAVFSYMSGPAFMSQDLFGKKEQGIMLGYVGLSYAIGFAIGAPLFGIIKAMSNFTVAWCVMVAFIVIGFSFLVSAIIKIKKLQKQYVKNNN